jgi:hypothetical protein
MEEVTAGIYLVSINWSRYSAVSGGGHAKTALLYAAISAAAHQRQRRHGLKKKSATQVRLIIKSILDEYDYLSIKESRSIKTTIFIES